LVTQVDIYDLEIRESIKKRFIEKEAIQVLQNTINLAVKKRDNIGYAIKYQERKMKAAESIKKRRVHNDAIIKLKTSYDREVVGIKKLRDNIEMYKNL
jgi:hypothetical protein